MGQNEIRTLRRMWLYILKQSKKTYIRANIENEIGQRSFGSSVLERKGTQEVFDCWYINMVCPTFSVQLYKAMSLNNVQQHDKDIPSA